MNPRIKHNPKHDPWHCQNVYFLRADGENFHVFPIFQSREHNEPLHFICDCVLYGRALPAMRKMSSARCELSGCSVVVTPDNTNFRCPAISQEGLSASRLSPAALGESGLHQ